MAKDDLLSVFMKLAEGDKAAPFLDPHWNRRPHRNRTRGYAEALRIGKDAGSFLLNQDALLLPGAKVAGGAGINAFAALGIEEFKQTENDADQIERAALVISLLHGRRDFVVGLSDHIIQLDGGGVVTPCAKRIKCGPFERSSSPCRRWKLRV